MCRTLARLLKKRCYNISNAIIRTNRVGQRTVVYLHTKNFRPGGQRILNNGFDTDFLGDSIIIVNSACMSLAAQQRGRLSVV